MAKPNGTSIASIVSRLKQDGHVKLLEGVLDRRISAYAAGCQAGYFKRKPISPGGNTNQMKRRYWAMRRVLADGG